MKKPPLTTRRLSDLKRYADGNPNIMQDSKNALIAMELLKLNDGKLEVTEEGQKVLAKKYKM